MGEGRCAICLFNCPPREVSIYKAQANASAVKMGTRRRLRAYLRHKEKGQQLLGATFRSQEPGQQDSSNQANLLGKGAVATRGGHVDRLRSSLAQASLLHRLADVDSAAASASLLARQDGDGLASAFIRNRNTPSFRLGVVRHRRE